MFLSSVGYSSLISGGGDNQLLPPEKRMNEMKSKMAEMERDKKSVEATLDRSLPLRRN